MFISKIFNKLRQHIKEEDEIRSRINPKYFLDD